MKKIKNRDYAQVKIADSNSKAGRRMNKLFDLLISPLLRLRTFQMAYWRAMNDPDPTDAWTKFLQQLNTTLDISSSDLARIPATGPLIVVANHPHGIMDGLLVGSLMHRVRDDFKIIINEATTMPGLEDCLLFVSIFGSEKENAKKNINIMRQALEWLKAGHAIVIFPAGEISAIKHMHDKIALDNTWNTNIIRLSTRSNAPILPLFIAGQNDNIFLKLGLIHPLFRTLQIGRVTNQLRNRTLTVRASQPIAIKKIHILDDDETKVNFIRSTLYSLMMREPEHHRVFDAAQADVINNASAFDQMSNIFLLLNAHSDFKVCDNGSYTVLMFNQQQLLELGPQYAEIFQTLKDEIGRLRELTFREVGEGSGQARDLDRFDEYYYHLTLWDHHQKKLVGAYRVAFTDEIFPQYGVQGLYTALQFEYQSQFFAAIGPAMEVSRAFVIKEHQKTKTAFSTLLGALAQVLVKRPHIRSFFGAVSISNDFQVVSKKLIIDFLTQYHGRVELSPWVTPKNPPQLTTQLPAEEWQRLKETVCDLSLLNTVVSSIEPDGKSIPTLIPAYISLQGRFVSFDYDVEFNSIDGLLVTNMHEATAQSAALMMRLMGKKNYETYIHLEPA